MDDQLTNNVDLSDAPKSGVTDIPQQSLTGGVLVGTPPGPTFAEAMAQGAAGPARKLVENDLPSAARRSPVPSDAEDDDEEQRDLTIDDVLASIDEEIRIPINARSGRDTRTIGFAIMQPIDPKTLRKWKTTYTGGISQKNARPKEANDFLIEQKFVRFERFTCPWQDDEGKRYLDPIDWMKRSRRGQVLADGIVGQYIAKEIPDLDDIKG